MHTDNIKLRTLNEELINIHVITFIICLYIFPCFGPVNTDNVSRIRNNMEIDKLIEGADIVRFINLLAPEFHIQILAHPVCKM